MSYSDFINTLGYGCNLIFNGIVTIANSLLSNYIVITILGLGLFTFVIDIIVHLIHKIRVHRDIEYHKRLWDDHVYKMDMIEQCRDEGDR